MSRTVAKQKKRKSTESADDMMMPVFKKHVSVFLREFSTKSQAEAWAWIGENEQLLPYPSSLLRNVECTSRGEVHLQFDLPADTPEYRRIQRSAKDDNPYEGPTTAVRVRGSVEEVEFKYHNKRYTAPLRDGEVVIVGTDLEHFQVTTKACQLYPFDVAGLTDDTFLYSIGHDLTECKVEELGSQEDWVDKGSGELSPGAFKEMRVWPCTQVCKDETGNSEYLLVELPNMNYWEKFVPLVSQDRETNIRFTVNPSLPLIHRRALINTFRACRNLGSNAKLPKKQPCFYGPGSAVVPAGGVTYAFRSVAGFDRLFVRHVQSSVVSPVLAALASGTFLGNITALYRGGHAVMMHLHR